MIELFRTFIVNILNICQVAVCPCALSGTEMKIFIDFFLNVLKKVIILCCFLLFYFIEEIIWLNYNLDVIFSWCQIVHFIMLVKNCPVPNYPFLLCWCEIVQCQIVLVPNCPGAKLSVFNSYCQIVLQSSGILIIMKREVQPGKYVEPSWKVWKVRRKGERVPISWNSFQRVL